MEMLLLVYHAVRVFEFRLNKHETENAEFVNRIGICYDEPNHPATAVKSHAIKSHAI